MHGTWIFRGLQGRRLSSRPHLMALPFPLPALLPPDQLYISVQHCQDLNDKVTSIHHIRDDPVQVSDGCLDAQQGRNEEAIWGIPCRWAGPSEFHLGASLRLPEETPASEDPPAVWVQMGLVTFSPSAPRKAVKATLVLLPLLGITYMLFFVNPGEDELSQIVFIYFNSFLQSFQVGRMVGWGRSEPP